MSEQIDLSIIIPAYNEAGVIDDSLARLAEFLQTRDYGQVEVLVVVPDSPDGTAGIARAKAGLFEEFRVIDAGERVGKGRDVRLGMMEARGRYRMFMDADLATPLTHLDDVYHLMQSGAKVGIAVRDLVRIHKAFIRKLISKASNIAAQILLVPGIKDTQCGFKVFEAEAAREIFSRQTMLSWSFDVELLVIAKKLGYTIHFIQAPDWKDPKAEGMGLSGDSPVVAALRGLWDLVVIRVNAWLGRYRKPSFDFKPSRLAD